MSLQGFYRGTLNYEDDNSDDVEYFENVDQSSIDKTNLFDHTHGIGTGTYKNAQMLSGADGSVIGSVLTIPVKPGDEISAEVYAMYMQATSIANPGAAVGSLLMTALTGGYTATTTYEGSISNSFGETGSIITNPVYENTVDATEPMAFINLMFLPSQEEDMIAKSNFSYKQISSSSNGAHARLALDEPFVAPQAGYVVIYLSNENSKLTEVYFDDLEITVNQSNIIQATNYYPFGLQQSTSWTRSTSLKNNYLYNAGSELNEMTKNYETFYRNYDPAIGRFNGVDIMATAYHSASPYSFANNDPVYFNDPMGDMPQAFLLDMMVMNMDGARDPVYNSLPGMSGSGRIESWANGMGNSDWSANGGSQMYRDGLASGLTDIGGSLYRMNGNGSRDLYGERNGQAGFWVDEGFTTFDYGYINGEETLLKTFGVKSTFVEAQNEDFNGVNFKDDPTHPGQINLKDASKTQTAVHLLKGIRYHVATKTDIDLKKLFSCLDNTCNFFEGTHTSGKTSINMGGQSVYFAYEIPFHGPRLDNFDYTPSTDNGNGYGMWKFKWGYAGIGIYVKQQDSKMIRNYLGL